MSFVTKNGDFFVESVSIKQIAASVGTPFYVYSDAVLRKNYQLLSEALSDVNALICFAVKANSNLSVLKTFGSMGGGADVVSEGELRRALKAGISPEKIVFAGVGKAVSEIEFALMAGIYQFNVESLPELESINDVATRLGKEANISIRVNPDVDALSHSKISTGRKQDKFGVSIDFLDELIDFIKDSTYLRLKGISTHIGSQLTQLEPFSQAFQKIRILFEEIDQKHGIRLERLDLGGGIGIPYQEKLSFTMQDYAAVIQDVFKDLDVQFVFEPGRSLAGEAGVLVSEVLYVKKGAIRDFIIVDGAMNDLKRQALYDAYHHISVLTKNTGAEEQFDVVGPVCESSDVFGTSRSFVRPSPGDIVLIHDAGAYGATMSSYYNTRLLVPEVLVKGDQFSVIRPRPTYEEIFAREPLAQWLSE